MIEKDIIEIKERLNKIEEFMEELSKENLSLSAALIGRVREDLGSILDEVLGQDFFPNKNQQDKGDK